MFIRCFVSIVADGILIISFFFLFLPLFYTIPPVDKDFCRKSHVLQSCLLMFKNTRDKKVQKKQRVRKHKSAQKAALMRNGLFVPTSICPLITFDCEILRAWLILLPMKLVSLFFVSENIIEFVIFGFFY